MLHKPLPLIICLLNVAANSRAERADEPRRDCEHPESAAKVWSTARSLQGGGMYRSAAAQWESFIRRFPSDDRIRKALLDLGLCRFAQKDYPGAAAAFSELTRSHQEPNELSVAWHWLATSQYHLARAGKASYGDAAESFKGAFDACPNGRYARHDMYFRALCLGSNGQLHDACASAKRVTEIWDDGELVPDAWLLLGRLEQSRGDDDSASNAFEHLIKRWPKLLQARLAHEAEGQRQFHAAHYAIAAEHFLAAADGPRFEGSAISLYSAAVCLERDGKTGEAIKLYSRVAELFPE